MESTRVLERSATPTITAAYYASFVGIGLTNASLGPLLPLLADQVRVGLADVSVLFTGRWLGYLLGSFFGGGAYDRRSGHPLMAASLVLAAITTALTPVVGVLWGLVLLMVFLGASEGVVDVGGNTLLIWLHRAKVGPYMNGLHFFYGIGALASPLIISQAALAHGQYAWAMWLISFLFLPVAFAVLRLPSPPGQFHSPSEPATARGPRGQSRGSHRRNVLLFVLFFMAAIGVEQSFGGWIYAFAVNTGLATAQPAAVLTSLFWGAFTLSRLASIPLSKHVSARSYMTLSLTGCTFSLLLLNALRLPAAASVAGAVLWLGTILLGMFIAPVFPMTLCYAGERTRIFGQVTGLLFVGVSAGGMLIPWLIGQFFETAGPHSAMVILLVALLASIGLFAWIDRRTAR